MFKQAQYSIDDSTYVLKPQCCRHSWVVNVDLIVREAVGISATDAYPDTSTINAHLNSSGTNAYPTATAVKAYEFWDLATSLRLGWTASWHQITHCVHVTRQCWCCQNLPCGTLARRLTTHAHAIFPPCSISPLHPPPILHVASWSQIPMPMSVATAIILVVQARAY